MDYWLLLSFIIQLLLALGNPQEQTDTDAVEWDSQQYMRTEKVVTFNPLEDVIGATFHNEYLLIYSANILTIIDISQNSTLTPAYKFLTNFHPKKLVTGYSSSQLLLLTEGQHCVQEMTFQTRQISVFSGKCDEPGYRDGDSDNARFNLPSDLVRSDDYYYIADFNNDCIRRLHQDGSVRVVISIHSKPFALSSNLFVAARKRVFKVKDSMHTYVGFVSDVNALTLESCSPGVLSMLTTDKCLHLLPITSDLSLQSRVINSTFSDLLCRGGQTIVTKMSPSDTTSGHTTMQLISVDVQGAVGIEPDTTTSSIPVTTPVTTPDSTTTPTTRTPTETPSKRIQTTNTTTIASTSTTTPVTQLSQTPMAMERMPTTSSKTTSQPLPGVKVKASHLPPSINVTKSPKSSNYSIFNGTTEDVWEPHTIIPLHNHAHENFDHLPNSYSQNNGSWKVIVPVVLAAATLLLILVTFACILRKRSKRHLFEETEEEEMYDYSVTDNLIIPDYNSSSCNSSTEYRSSSSGSSVPPNVKVVDILADDQVELAHQQLNGNGVHAKSNGVTVNGNGLIRARHMNGKTFPYTNGVSLPPPLPHSMTDLHQQAV